MNENGIVQFSSVTQLCLTVCNSMDYSTPGFPVHQFPEPAQTHVHRVSDAIQLSHPLSSPSLLAFNLSRIRVFSSEEVFCIRWPKYWSFSFSISPSNDYSGLISFKMDLLDHLAVQGTLKSLFNTTIKNINFSVLSFLYSPTVTSTHDYWKNHSFD